MQYVIEASLRNGASHPSVHQWDCYPGTLSLILYHCNWFEVRPSADEISSHGIEPKYPGLSPRRVDVLFGLFIPIAFDILQLWV